MIVPEEISAWSLEELEAATQALLPQGWTVLELPHKDGYWVVQLQRLDVELRVVTEVEERHIDKKIAYLNVYGWLWLKQTPAPSQNSPWVRRRELTVEAVTRHARVGGPSIPDPEDLDPIEVETVHKK